MDFLNTLFRCSSLGYIMTESKGKGGQLSETCKTHLHDVYVSNKYNRQSDVFNKYIEKGLSVEEDSITLYSRVTKKFYKKNSQHLHNEFIKGTPDLFKGVEITSADEIIDIKSSWDIFTFSRVRSQVSNKHYYWQLQGYLWLSGAVTAKLVYCLVNTPENIIEDEKRRLLYRMNVPNQDSELYKEACEQLELSMRYDDIPMHERVIEISIKRNDDDIEHIKQRVIDCRTFLNDLESAVIENGFTNLIT